MTTGDPITPNTIVIDGYMLGRSNSTMRLYLLLEHLRMHPDTRVVVLNYDDQHYSSALPKLGRLGIPGGYIDSESGISATHQAQGLREILEESRACPPTRSIMSSWSLSPSVLWGRGTQKFDRQYWDIPGVPKGASRWQGKSEWELPAHKRKRTKAVKPSPLIAALSRKL